jgi:hypothetical protein
VRIRLQSKNILEKVSSLEISVEFLLGSENFATFSLAVAIFPTSLVI